MRVKSRTHGSRGNVAAVVGVAVRSRALGAGVRAGAPPDCAAATDRDLSAAVGVTPNEAW